MGMKCEFCGGKFAHKDKVIPVLLHTVSDDGMNLVSWNRPIGYMHLRHLKEKS